jgi:1,4-dihydroxy-2-naphthoyl-CoA synthase
MTTMPFSSDKRGVEFVGIPQGQTGLYCLYASYAFEIAERGAFALASIKAAFNARDGGVAGLSRVTHDLLLSQYLGTGEARELNESFNQRRPPDPSKFGH